MITITLLSARDCASRYSPGTGCVPPDLPHESIFASRPCPYIKGKTARHLGGLTVALLFDALGGADSFMRPPCSGRLGCMGRRWGMTCPDGIRYLATQWRIIVPIAGAFIAGVILYWAMRIERRIQDAGDYLDVIDGRAERMPILSSLLRCALSFSSIVSGGSVGKEGPMVQLVAVVASYLSSDWRHVNPERVRTTIAIAAAGGLAVVYHVPWRRRCLSRKLPIAVCRPSGWHCSS